MAARRPVRYRCLACGAVYALTERVWSCMGCEEPLWLDPAPALDLTDVDASAAGIWRFAAALPEVPEADRVTLGEGGTPLVPAHWDGVEVLFKLEQLQPTGSYKDRGAALLMSMLRSIG